MKVMISLIGEQPAPNLLPVRHYRPEHVVLVYTKRTEKIRDRLNQLIRADVYPLEVSPYAIDEISDQLERYVLEREWDVSDLLFNVTGGTKPMALAATMVAQRIGAPIIYFQSEGKYSRIYKYNFYNDQNSIKPAGIVEVDSTISLDDYLTLYLGDYDTGEPRHPLETAVRDVLEATPLIDEVFTSIKPASQPALEVDLIIRCGNQIGVGEIKMKGAKAGIDQLAAVTDQRYLGTYVAKFLISGESLHHNNRHLAQAYNIMVIELKSFAEMQQLNEIDRDSLARTIVSRLRR